MDVLTRSSPAPGKPLVSGPRTSGANAPPDGGIAPPPASLGTGATTTRRSGSALAPLLAAWFQAHGEGLWRLVVRLGVPAHSADDIVQEAFIVASRRSADVAAGQERRFLVGTAIRLCSNYRQRVHVRREVACSDTCEGVVSPTPNAEQLLIERAWRERLERVLGELSDTHRATFVLYELEGFSMSEIAELLGLPLGTVSSRLSRARTRFSELATALYGSSILEEER